LAEQDPGFAKLFFLLEQELLTPRYDLHGFTIPDLITGLPGSNPALEKAVSSAAQASLSAAAPRYEAFKLSANSHQAAVQRVRAQQKAFFNLLAQGLLITFLILPLALLLLTMASLQREDVLGRSLAVTLGILVLLAAVLMLWPGLTSSFMERLEQVSLAFGNMSDGVVLGIGIAGLVGMVGLLVWSIVFQSQATGWSLGLLVLSLVALIGLDMTSSQTDIFPVKISIYAALAAVVLLPLSFLLLTSGMVMRKQVFGAVAALPLTVFLMVGLFPVVQTASYAGMTSVFAPTTVLQGQGLVVAEAAVPLPSDLVERVGKDLPPGTNQAEPPRLRQHFPETMLWLPDAVTDERGRLHLSVPLADSITTWRMTALASTQAGQLGSTTAPLRVFQDFFVDPDLPLSLTVGDEISVPVGIFNYLPEAQDVKLEVEPADWFDLLDPAAKSISVDANEISVVYFRIRVKSFGRQSFKLTAWGSKMSDAVQKEIRIYPNGKQVNQVVSDRLEPEQPVEAVVNLPWDAIDGTQSVVVKIYPGVVSQVVEGLDSILRMPNGCFEQTSSATYPNVLVLDYLRNSGLNSPKYSSRPRSISTWATSV
jgi:hypothetical protein